MKLNHDCIRNLLLFLEVNLKTKSNGNPKGIKLRNITGEDHLAKFTENDIYYSAGKLVEINYIKLVNNSVAPRRMIINEITWDGHDYIDSIRDSKVWSEVKNKTKGLSDVAIDIVKGIAVEIIKGRVNNFHF